MALDYIKTGAICVRGSEDPVAEVEGVFDRDAGRPATLIGQLSPEPKVKEDTRHVIIRSYLEVHRETSLAMFVCGR
jgi:hypothetical protein